ncbi:hypothetical protein [Methylobacterium sp. J-090]|uniref:hypothetical protein n=1 Tax=Methylobacterium sp. J-090 TaxID=2836666 RepID=UPI0028BD587B|nr:hypothetical protein [Methylobacterium sp. J-090]
MKSHPLDAALLPDVLVVCGGIEVGATSVGNPTVLIEVLSPGTDARDRLGDVADLSAIAGPAALRPDGSRSAARESLRSGRWDLEWLSRRPGNERGTRTFRDLDVPALKRNLPGRVHA